MSLQKSLEEHFAAFKKQTVGDNFSIKTVYGNQKLLYADWIASGRLYAPIEDVMMNTIGPMVANTHSFSSETGKASTYAYKHAREIIKQHVNANKNDVLVTTGSGMTAAVVKLQRIVGLRMSYKKDIVPEEERPVVFITHMEHHSNQVSWMETIADVVILPPDDRLLVSPEILNDYVSQYANRKLKIGAFTACSNVTGIVTPYHEMAAIMHKHGGYCFVDFAASAPYVNINMHPEKEEEKLDAVLFSPHKFLGGPGSCGVLVFDRALYGVDCPDFPGGGNVKWTNPWGEYSYFDDIETKEDGGTPGFLQAMRAALSIRLKEQMGVDNIHAREKELLEVCFESFNAIDGVFVLGAQDVDRVGCVSFGIEGIHYNLVVRLLNDRFGIQVRGGWSCASTYGHHLFNIDKAASKALMADLENKNLSNKPGWVRLSLHPTLSNAELNYICDAVAQIANNFKDWQKDYIYNTTTNEFDCINQTDDVIVSHVKNWFTL